MIPCSFEGENGVLNKPDGMTDEECSPLNIRRDEKWGSHGAIISCWKLEAQEIDDLLKTPKLWLVVCGNSMPPVYLTTRQPFDANEKPPTEYQITKHFVCPTCLKKYGKDILNQSQITVGITEKGLQIWCRECGANVIHWDNQWNVIG